MVMTGVSTSLSTTELTRDRMIMIELVKGELIVAGLGVDGLRLADLLVAGLLALGVKQAMDSEAMVWRLVWRRLRVCMLLPGRTRCGIAVDLIVGIVTIGGR